MTCSILLEETDQVRHSGRHYDQTTGGGNYSVVDDVHDVQTTSVIVFPNPATAQISMSGMTEGDRYEIFSSTGVLVDAGIWTGDPVEITDLASGMYL